MRLPRIFKGTAPGKTPPRMGPLPGVEDCDCQICRPEPVYDQQERAVIDTVLTHGWQVNLVSATLPCSDPEHHHHDTQIDHDDHGPAFAYTVGLGHRAGHPELVMSGLDPDVMHRALNEVARRVLAGRRLHAGDAVEGVLASVPVAIEEMGEFGLRQTVTWSGWFHRRRPDALVLVWPTTSGVFAWQPGAPAVLDETQPPAWRTPIVHDGALAADPEWLFPVPPDRLAFSCTHVVDNGEPILWAPAKRIPCAARTGACTAGRRTPTNRCG